MPKLFRNLLFPPQGNSVIAFKAFLLWFLVFFFFIPFFSELSPQSPHCRMVTPSLELPSSSFFFFPFQTFLFKKCPRLGQGLWHERFFVVFPQPLSQFLSFGNCWFYRVLPVKGLSFLVASCLGNLIHRLPPGRGPFLVSELLMLMAVPIFPLCFSFFFLEIRHCSAHPQNWMGFLVIPQRGEIAFIRTWMFNITLPFPVLFPTCSKNYSCCLSHKVFDHLRSSQDVTRAKDCSFLGCFVLRMEALWFAFSPIFSPCLWRDKGSCTILRLTLFPRPLSPYPSCHETLMQ